MSPRAFHDKIMELSEEKKDIRAAISEWTTEYCRDEWTSCICGHQILRIFKATNTLNSNIMEPIGCVCIDTFATEYDLRDTAFYASHERACRVWCPDCGISLINRSAFGTHMKTKKHIRNIGSWPCVGCGVRIESHNPKWKTRCLRCYKKSQ